MLCCYGIWFVSDKLYATWYTSLCISRDIQKGTQNFTTILGQGSFGPVYKATMPAGEVVAVKVLASDSKQGEKEFQTEVNANVQFTLKMIIGWSILYCTLHEQPGFTWVQGFLSKPCFWVWALCWLNTLKSLW